jgi:Fic/DOC family
MPSPAENLANSLDVLKQLQEDGIVAIKSEELSRTDRERLFDNGFIKEVYKGWYISVSPEEKQGDTTSWYSNYWEFCSQLLNDKYGEKWYVSPEQSILLHAGNKSIPEQLIIRSPEAENFRTDLLYQTSLFHIRSALPKKSEIVEIDGIRALSVAAAIIQASPTLFIKNPIDTRAALLLIKDSSEVLNILLEGGHRKIAWRLAGAFRNVGQDRIADDLMQTMQKGGYEARELDPFDGKVGIFLSNRVHSPYENRIKLMWYQMRDRVIKISPPAPGIPVDKNAYMEAVQKIYVTDAYHSLSIERYKVTPELIERVRSGAWDIGQSEGDQQQRDAMAAKGYWEAFKAVETSVQRILDGENASNVVDKDHGNWYRELFGPSVTAGLLKPGDLAGYRNHSVYISQSKHIPLNSGAVRDVIPVLFTLLKEEQDSFVRSVMGHFIFVFIHPYMDGNGRMGRFLMNAMLASGGYPWTVIPVEQRKEYMLSLEEASVNQNIQPFAFFLGNLVREAMEGHPVARI